QLGNVCLEQDAIDRPHGQRHMVPKQRRIIGQGKPPRSATRRLPRRGLHEAPPSSMSRRYEVARYKLVFERGAVGGRPEIDPARPDAGLVASVELAEVGQKTEMVFCIDFPDRSYDVK